MNLALLSSPPPLLRSALQSVLPILLLLAVAAIAIAETFQLSVDYMLQSIAVFIGLLCALLPFLPQHQPLQQFGAANTVTLLRAGIAALTAGFIGQSPLAPTLAWGIAALTGIALILDGIDGWLARRSEMQSPFGARFDMEVDAFFILTLAALVYQADKAGAWVLLSGAMRYGFVISGYVLPWLRRPLPPRKRRQAICVLQTVALALCLLPPLLPPWTTALAALVLGLLTLSFTVDIISLARCSVTSE